VLGQGAVLAGGEILRDDEQPALGVLFRQLWPLVVERAASGKAVEAFAVPV
jgi:hypothetical protein